MSANEKSRADWIMWLIGVVVFPLPFVFMIGGMAMNKGRLWVTLLATWAVVIAFVSAVPAEALARQRGKPGLFSRLALWLGLTLAGFLVSLAFFFGSCAVISMLFS